VGAWQQLGGDTALARAVAGRGGKHHYGSALAQVPEAPDAAAVGPRASEQHGVATVFPGAPAERVLSRLRSLDALAEIALPVPELDEPARRCEAFHAVEVVVVGGHAVDEGRV